MELLKDIALVAFGSLISIVPMIIDKRMEHNNKREENKIQDRKELYSSLLTSMIKFMKGCQDAEGLLNESINLLVFCSNF